MGFKIFLRWPPSWILELNNLSNSDSPGHPNTSHQVSAQSNFWFGRRCGLKNFKMAIILEEQYDSSNSESPCCPNASHKVWAQSDLVFVSRCGWEIFKMATMVAILDIGMNDFSNSESQCPLDPSHQVSA